MSLGNEESGRRQLRAKEGLLVLHQGFGLCSLFTTFTPQTIGLVTFTEFSGGITGKVPFICLNGPDKFTFNHFLDLQASLFRHLLNFL
jgi:hypothetical protein